MLIIPARRRREDSPELEASCITQYIPGQFGLQNKTAKHSAMKTNAKIKRRVKTFLLIAEAELGSEGLRRGCSPPSRLCSWGAERSSDADW